MVCLATDAPPPFCFATNAPSPFLAGMDEEKPGGKEDELEEFIKAGRTGRR